VCSSDLSRKIEHKRLSSQDIVKRFQDLGFPEDYANGLASMDVAISNGSEDQVTNNVKLVSGVAPMSMETFIKSNIHFWMN